MEKEKTILVTQSSMPSLDEYMEEISPIFESKWLTNNGEKHQQFEAALKKYLHVKNLTLFVNGHTALHTALSAMEFPSGSEIITTPYTFASTTHAIVQNGLTPVFCDIEPENYTIDPDKIEQLITDKTVAIMPVHVYGHVCNVDRLTNIAHKYNLKVFYDAAHVFGVTYRKKNITEYGDISMLSFHATKVFNSIEGGALVYRDQNLKAKFDLLKNFGIADAENVVATGMNGKMNEFAAAMGICNLRHVNEEITKRRRIHDHYMQQLGGVNGLILPKEQADVVSNYAYFPVIFDPNRFSNNRNDVYARLSQHNIFARKYFYPIITDYACYREKYNNGTTPIAKWVSDNVLTLPMYADLSLEDIDRICKIILEK